MIKNIKIGLFTALGVLALAGTALAVDTALIYSTDTTVTISARPYVIASGSKASTAVVGAANIVVTLADGGPFTFKSNNGDTLTNNGGFTPTCVGSVSTVTLTSTATITPTSVSACASSAPSGGGGTSGGGGGGGDVTAPVGTVSINAGAETISTLTSTLTLSATDAGVVTQMLISNDSGFAGASWESYATTKTWLLASGDGVKTVYAKFKDTAGNLSASASDSITVSGSGTVAVVVTTPAPTEGCSGGNLYNTSTGALCVNNSVTPPGCSGGNLFSTSTGAACNNNSGVTLNITNVPSSYALGTVTLKNGSRGNAVKELQRFLNDKLNLGLVVDGKLGPKTIAVIKKWQKDNGLKADGLIGPKTKALMNAQ